MRPPLQAFLVPHGRAVRLESTLVGATNPQKFAVQPAVKSSAGALAARIRVRPVSHRAPHGFGPEHLQRIGNGCSILDTVLSCHDQKSARIQVQAGAARMSHRFSIGIKESPPGAIRLNELRGPSGQRNEPFIFLREFLRCPRQVASLVPSSRLLQRRLVESAEIGSAKRVVELGPGTGGTTRAILRSMAPDAQLLTIEINSCLFEMVRRIQDERLTLHRGDAVDLREIVSGYGFDPPDVIVSGIPFSTIGRASARQLLGAIASTLAPRGFFVAYQVSKRLESFSSACLELETMEKHFVLFNLPPLWVTRWRKATMLGKPSVH